MNPIRQTPEYLAFGREDLRAGCQEGLYEEVTTGEAERIRSTGAIISPSFVAWQDGPEGRKGRFVVNLSKQSKHWPKGSVRMETLPEYALELERGERMVSFDIQAGYRHFRLAPQMRYRFLFRCDRRFYRCIALPFGLDRIMMWFTQLMVPMVRNLRQQYRVFACLDDFLICPVKAGRVVSMRDCRKARQVIDKLLSSLGLTRHPTKEDRVGSTRVEHLGCVIDSDRMRFYIEPRKIAKVYGIARDILRQARQGRRWVSRDKFRSYCGVCVSLSLAMPFARFYTRILFDDMTRRPRKSRASRNRNRCRLSHQSIRDLQMWRKLASTETYGRPIRPLPANVIMHTDAADVGLSGTLDVAGNPGDPGQWQDQGIWE
jgi:hypothetical protein